MTAVSLIFLAFSACSAPEDTSTPTQPTEEPGEDTAASGINDPVKPPVFESAETCKDCHSRQYKEWQQSMHAYGAISPVLDAMAAKTHRDTNGGVGTFCTGCHSPVGTAEGEPGSTTADQRSPTSREGVTCDVCHTAVDHTQPIGNTGLVFQTSENVKFGPFSSSATEGHRNQKSDFLTSANFCGSCHEVFNYPAIRLEETFSEYASGPAPEEGATCQGCHMGPTPGVVSERTRGPSAKLDGYIYPDREQVSHRFVGPDYSLLDDFPYPDDLEASAAAQEELAEQIQVLLENSVHIASAQVAGSGSARTLTVALESLTSGHNVPTGFTSERQLWVEVEVTKDDEVVFSSGDLDSLGDLRDKHSWEVLAGDIHEDTQLANLQSLNLLRWGGGQDIPAGSLPIVDTIFPFDANFIYRRSLAPYEKRAYEWNLFGLEPPYRVDVALNFRNLPPYVLRELQLDHLVERLRIFTIDSDSIEVQ